MPGLRRDPRKKLLPDASALLDLLHRWRNQAVAAGRQIARIRIAYEAGRDGFWLARWLRGEPKHCSMVAVPSLEAEDATRPIRER